MTQATQPPPSTRDESSVLDKVRAKHLGRAHSVALTRRAGGPFRRFARAASAAVGRPWAFSGAVAIVIAWALLGPLFHYSDTWQLVINTGTTIITFLMVFLIQNSQNRDTEALRLKLDELILATHSARNAFVDIDDLDDDQLAELEQELCVMAEQPDAQPRAREGHTESQSRQRQRAPRRSA